MNDSGDSIPKSPFFEKFLTAEFNEFRFLVETYEFHREVADYALEVTVRYIRGQIGVVVHMEPTNLPFVLLHPLAREGEALPWSSGVPLEVLVDVRCPDCRWTPADYGDPLTLSEKDLRAVFSRYAEILTRHAEDILRGDVAALRELKALSRRRKRRSK